MTVVERRRDPLQRLVTTTVVTEPGSYDLLEDYLRDELARTARQVRTVSWKVVAAEAYRPPAGSLGRDDLLLYLRADVTSVPRAVFALTYPLILGRCELTLAQFDGRTLDRAELDHVSYGCFHDDYAMRRPLHDQLIRLDRTAVVEVVREAW